MYERDIKKECLGCGGGGRRGEFLRDFHVCMLHPPPPPLLTPLPWPFFTDNDKRTGVADEGARGAG